MTKLASAAGIFCSISPFSDHSLSSLNIFAARSEGEEGRREAFGASKLLNLCPPAWLTLTQAFRSRTVLVA
jgi:hypothetical protein